MSDAVNAADDGAPVEPVENTASEQPVAQEQAQPSTTEHVDTPKDDKPRDDKGRFVPQERVNEITRARREAERRAEALERELASLRQNQPAQHQPRSTDKAPKLEDFDFDQAAWAQAVTEYAATQAESRVEQKLSARSQQERQQTVQRSFEERAAKYAAEHPDFDQAMDNLGQTVRFSPELIEAIGVSDHGPAVVHYLAQHLDEADRIARLPAHLAAVQLGRIEAKVSAPKPKPVTKAPDPAPSLGGGSSNASKDPQKMSYAEYKRYRQGK
jgi:hypothetical protein